MTKYISLSINSVSKTLISLSILLLTFSCNGPSKNTKQEVNNTEDAIPLEKQIPKTKYGIEIVDYNISKNTVKKNEFFSNILQNNDIPYSIVTEAIKASEGIFDVRRLRQGNDYYLFKRKDSSEKTDYIVYHLNATNYIKFNFSDTVIVSEHNLPITIDTNFAQGVVESSLWVSLKQGGFDPMLSMELSDIYASPPHPGPHTQHPAPRVGAFYSADCR